ncbi:MAG: Gfo/Idh/MocA family oxidoreductase [Gemmatimonadales bacterium]|jgi:predicted dehydrogenase
MSSKFSRREFLQTGAMATGGLLATRGIALETEAFAAAARPVAPSDTVRFGIIGVGMQGSGLMSAALSLSGVECVAASDLYDGRHELARELAGDTSLPTTRRYQEVLDREDIDCVIVAVPDHHHRQVVVDAVQAGKDVYCEKPMSHTAAEGFEMVEAATSAGRIVQVGSQRTSSALCAKARELYSDGAIGEVSMVELCLGRNSPTGAWQYPPPPGLSPSNLDWEVWLGTAPKIPFNPERFARWRCWKEYGTGVAGDLMVHLISGMLYTLDWNEPPRSAQALGGIYRWRDGRNMPDLHTVLFDYGGVQVYVRLGLGTATPEVARFMGPKGILEATAETLTLSPQTGRDTYPSYYSQSFPRALREEYQARWHAENDPTPGMEPITGNTVYTGHDWDDTVPHLWAFFEAVRSREPVVQDAAFGNHAAIACHMANESYFRESPVQWDDGGRVIAS